MADTLAHRGPDGRGFWRDRSAAIAHTRLSVIDPSEAGAQPMVSHDGRWVVSYNGELYNDAELREELGRRGVAFGSSCDTETVAAAVSAWGSEAFARMRGMYALAAYDSHERTLLLARDPMGIKPMYVAELTGEVVFGSEPVALFAHPGVRCEPDPVGVSAYLSTIRVTLGPRTMFAGVESLEPGEVRAYSPRGCARNWVPSIALRDAGETRDVVSESISRHLRSDVSLCSLLSGGLDSSVVALVATGGVASLHTYCSGDAAGGPDVEYARLVAAHLGTHHTDVGVTRELFAERWRWLVGASRVPLCTPNEVAIYEVARALREAAHVVTLSGEGADELFAGYEAPLSAAWEHIARGNDDPGVFQLDAHAWTPRSIKEDVFQPGFWDAALRDEALVAFYRAAYDRGASEPGVGHPLEAHLRLHRQINLTGLLRRLDSSTMRASVEGRTPFADTEVASHAASLRIDEKCAFNASGGTTGTKLSLRRAFAQDLPMAVIERPKQSFPLPFQSWLSDARDIIGRSGYLRLVFRDAAIEAVVADPGGTWSMAWPMANLALWAEANAFDHPPA